MRSKFTSDLFAGLKLQLQSGMRVHTEQLPTSSSIVYEIFTMGIAYFTQAQVCSIVQKQGMIS